MLSIWHYFAKQRIKSERFQALASVLFACSGSYPSSHPAHPLWNSGDFESSVSGWFRLVWPVLTNINPLPLSPNIQAICKMNYINSKFAIFETWWLLVSESQATNTTYPRYRSQTDSEDWWLSWDELGPMEWADVRGIRFYNLRTYLLCWIKLCRSVGNKADLWPHTLTLSKIMSLFSSSAGATFLF